MLRFALGQPLLRKLIAYSRDGKTPSPNNGLPQLGNQTISMKL